MGTSGTLISGFSASKQAVGRTSCLALLILGIAAAAAPVPAAAWSEEPTAPEYSLSIVEGETTLPGRTDRSPPAATSEPRAEVVAEDHSTTARSWQQGTGSNGDVWLSQVPQVGDVVDARNAVRTPGRLGRLRRPALDGPDGLRRLDELLRTALPGNGSRRRAPTRWCPTPTATRRARPGGEAQVTALSGQSFARQLPDAPGVRQTVQAVERCKRPSPAGRPSPTPAERAPRGRLSRRPRRRPHLRRRPRCWARSSGCRGPRSHGCCGSAGPTR